MKSYTEAQLKEFLQFVKRHNITFNTLREAESAIAQYYNGE